MSQSIRLDSAYWDSSSITHKRTILSEYLDTLSSNVTTVSNKLNYSTSEIEIGVWNNRKAYRKIFITSYSTTGTNFISTGLSNVSIFNIYGTFIGGSHTIPINFYNTQWCFCHANAQGTRLTYGNAFETETVHIVIEYVKNN